MSATHNAAAMAEFGKALVEKTVDELQRWMVKDGMPTPEVGALFIMIHHTMEITSERLGPAGVKFMLEGAELFATSVLARSKSD